MASIHALRHVPLFTDVPDSDLAPLADCLVHRSFAHNVIVFNEGSPGHALYIIESGRVRIYLTSNSGQEITLNVYGPGQVFGEISLLDGQPRSASAVAIEPASVLVLDREDFLRFMDTHAQVVHNVIAMLTARLRHTTTYAESLVFLDVQGRLAAKLLDMAGWFSSSDDVSIELTMSQGELATWAATSRESINKALSEFREQGLITVNGQKVTILNLRDLRRKVVF